ncbi:helix-turn-helix domain-containing protein [Enterococcus casseliflavus]|uniref:helix-turn-helix domain-containing protein n=1 Tax=Enterococcus sp. 4E1_DIV0656 TaxID=1834180 RepID=UPI000A39D3DD|nr:Rgg/GadR/MutR family transcriptional regulator [Enterococcus sp. 4E1_DIV0656]MEC5316870.1 helix-turn-helix domain-containing protein [Enterococcus casseliflavus]OTO12368.1 hypothetical protein A5882_000755 [Enterococcus sp. 4E1_DIV0656]
MFGETIREIRLKKGFSQKEVYRNIISKSYAIEFEKGKHNISSDVLIKILENLSMDISEFLFIANGYKLNEQNHYTYNYANLSNKQDIKGLALLLKELERKSGQINAIRVAEVRSRIRILQHLEVYGVYNTAAVLEEDKQLILSYLMGIESWTLQEIHLFANTLDFLDHEFIFIFFKRVSKLLEYYIQFEKGREVYCGLLINIIEYTFVKKQYEFAEVLLTQLGLLSTSFQDFFSRTLYKFFEGLLIMRTVNEEQGRTMATRMLDIMIELDQAPLSKMFSLLLE